MFDDGRPPPSAEKRASAKRHVTASAGGSVDLRDRSRAEKSPGKRTQSTFHRRPVI